MATPSPAVSRLLKLRDSLTDAWTTMDSESVHTFERIFKNLNAAGKDVLEIGSGHGLTCILFAMMGARNAYGIELMKDAVASSERVRDEMDSKLPAFFTCGDAGKRLPYADSSLDIVLVIEVISHVIVSSLDAFVKECLRVLRPGGILYISDGNNAASPMLRRKNHEIWDRFENGPPTAPNEDVHTHHIKKPYVISRREIAREAVPRLTDEEADQIARLTFRYSAAEVTAAATRYATTRELPTSPFKPRVCATEPRTYMYIEELIDPFALMKLLNNAGANIKSCTSRRQLPLQGFWNRVPWLTMRLTNGFVVIAEKR